MNIEEAPSVFNGDTDAFAQSGHAFTRAWKQVEKTDDTARQWVRIKTRDGLGRVGDNYAVKVPVHKVTEVVTALLNDPKVHSVAVGDFAENV